MASSGEKQTSKRKAFEISKQAQVLVFDESKYGIRKRLPRAGGKTNEKEHESTPASTPKDADEYFGASVADMEVNEIWERLKDTVDDIHASNLKGKERKRHMFEKVTRLGGKPPKKQLAPMNIRIGITEKQKARETKRQAQAREMDLVIARGKTGTSRSRKGRK